MKIIKLNAIDSTNSFLKEMSVNTDIDNFTVVVAKEQTAGRGQMNNKWVSEAGKNLTFSVFLRFSNLLFENQKFLNFAVSISVFEAVKSLAIDKLKIKWPNDIMAANSKIGGILIENSLKAKAIYSSVVGIGLNVNQEQFFEGITKANSLKNILGKEISLDDLLKLILDKLKQNISLLEKEDFGLLEQKYLENLYKKDIPSMFKNTEGELFMGKIIGVSQEGKLQVELVNETIKEFDLKEVSFA